MSPRDLLMEKSQTLPNDIEVMLAVGELDVELQ